MQETLVKTNIPSSYVAREPITSKRFLISIKAKSSFKKLKKTFTTIKNQKNTAATITEVKNINTSISPTCLKK